MIGALEYSLIDISLAISAILIAAGAICSFIRIIIGPTMANRVIALDYFSYLAIAALALLAIHFDDHRYLDVAIVFALLAFLAVVAFARYVWQKLQGNLTRDKDNA